MATINLLPWREELRKQKQIDFLIFLGAGVLASILVMFMVHVVINNMVDTQKNRNRFIQNEVAVLDAKIIEIKDLEKTKGKLLARMEVVQRLQSSRPEVVHLFDELAKTVPEGVSLTKVTQRGVNLVISGRAQSNTRVSAYMRGVEQSLWLKGASLDVIRSQGTDENSFRIKVVQAKADEKTGGGE